MKGNNGTRRRSNAQRWPRIAELRDWWCQDCTKWAYRTAKRADRARDNTPAPAPEKQAMHTYPCPTGRGYHYGHEQRTRHD